MFQSGAVYDALVRFSNARGEILGDLSKDQRGIAIRVKTDLAESLSPKDDSNIQDFLMTNTPISFARNPVSSSRWGRSFWTVLAVSFRSW